MFRKIAFYSCLLVAFLIIPLSNTSNLAFCMGSKPDMKSSAVQQSQSNVPQSDITLKQLADIYWPDSNATELQQEETLKNLLGKRVNWLVTVAQIQRAGEGYLVQGQSSKDMVGTFSYITPQSEAEKEAILHAQMGSQLDVSGIVNDMQMRHIVLKPANVIVK